MNMLHPLKRVWTCWVFDSEPINMQPKKQKRIVNSELCCSSHRLPTANALFLPRPYWLLNRAQSKLHSLRQFQALREKFQALQEKAKQSEVCASSAEVA